MASTTEDRLPDETIQALVEARRGDPFAVDRVLALLDKGGVVDHQHRLGPADDPVGLPDQRARHPCAVP